MRFLPRTPAVAALASALLAAPLAAEPHEPYISLGGLAVLPKPSDTEATFGPRHWQTEIKLKDSLGFFAAAGYGRDSGLGGELEVAYRSADFRELAGATVTGGPEGRIRLDRNLPYEGSGDFFSVMANGIFAGKAGKFRTYVGAGVGIAFVNGKAPTQEYEFGGNTFVIEGADEKDTVFAWQGIIGLGYPLTPNTQVQLGYRYFAANAAKFTSTDVSFTAHNIHAGVRFSF